jgi:putative spermidine/putrescine transport system substrate-binding protein
LEDFEKAARRTIDRTGWNTAMTRHFPMALALAAATWIAGVEPGLAQEDKSPLIFLSTGGPNDTITRNIVVNAFTAETGIEVLIRPQSDAMIGAVLAQKDKPQYDLILTGFDSYIYLKNNDVLDTVNYDDIPNTANLYPLARSTHGIGTSFTGVTLVYNTEKIRTPPTSWADLWNPAYKGHVIIPLVPISYGLDFLVMAARTFGGDEHNIDVGFQKLKELAPHVGGIYETSSNAAQMFQLGGAWIAPWFAGRVPPTRAAGVPVAAAKLKEGQVVYITMLAPLKGRYSKKVAKFINTYLTMEAQIAFAKGVGQGPARSDVVLDPDLAATVPYGSDQISELVHPDWDTIVHNRVEWADRFQREIVPLVGRR